MKTSPTLIIAALLTLACVPFERLKTAIADLDIPPGDRDRSCEWHAQHARGQAENAWSYDWPTFAPMFETPPDPARDEAFCRGIIEAAGATFASKTESNSSTAICRLVALGADFETWPAERRAAVMCHEAAHIVEQGRMGCGYWGVSYATFSGRLASEGTAYALGDAVLERHGWTPGQLAAAQAKRAAAFPERYRLPPRVVTSECVLDYFGRLRAALADRSGF